MGTAPVNILASRMLQGKRLLIFDFDGTLADTTPLHAAAFTQVLAPLGVSVDYESIAGMKTLDAIRKCLNSGGRILSRAEMQSLAVTKQRLVREMIEDDLLPLAGVSEFLRWARTGFRLSIATSGSCATVALALRRLGYTGWFDPVVCSEDVQRTKPAPDAFLRVLEITGVNPSEAVVFEDSEAGFAAARAAGLQFVNVRGTGWTWTIGRFNGN